MLLYTSPEIRLWMLYDRQLLEVLKLSQLSKNLTSFSLQIVYNPHIWLFKTILTCKKRKSAGMHLHLISRLHSEKRLSGQMHHYFIGSWIHPLIHFGRKTFWEGPKSKTSTPQVFFKKILCWGYIVTFTKVFTMHKIYHTWIHPLHHSLLFSPPPFLE
jgi:hypothetical protein